MLIKKTFRLCIIIFSTIFFINNSIIGQNKGRTDITEYYLKGTIEKIVFKPNLVKIRNNNFEINIKPISNDSLGNTFTYYYLQSGIYYKQKFYEGSQDYTLKPLSEKEKGKDNDKPNPLEKIINAVENYCYKNNINMNKTRVIVDLIISTYNSNLIYNSNNNIPSINKTIDLYTQKKINPYVIKGNELSVFKLELKNNTDNNEELKLSNFSFLLKNIQLHIYNTKELKGYTKSVANHMILDIFNFPNSITLPPHSTIVKYIATTPIPKRDSKLKIYYNELSSVTDIHYIKNIIDQKKVYYRLHINNMYQGKQVFILNKNNQLFTIENDDMLIPEDHLKDIVNIISVYRDKNEFRFIIKELNLSEYINRNGQIKPIENSYKDFITVKL